MEFPQKHTISTREINRRKRAFLSLILSLFISVTLSLKILLDLPYLELFLSMTVFAAFLLICRLLMEKAFHSFRKINIVLTDGYVERLTQKGNEIVYYKDIDTISIKKTINKNVREIKIKSKDKQLYLNGLAEMNDLSRTLQNQVSKDTKIIQRSEWIDFDSKYFYPILGILIGSGAIFLFSSMINSDIHSIRVVMSSFLVFVTGLGVYFIITKPISKSHGPRFRVLDIVIGTIFVLLGLGLQFLYLN